MPEVIQRVEEIKTMTGLSTYIFDKTAPPAGPGPEFVLDTEKRPISPEKGLLLIFSSGTTGPPKGILHSRKNVTVGIQGWIEYLGSSACDTWLHCSPVHWMFGCQLVFVCSTSSARIQFGDSLGALDVVLRYLQRGHITGLFLSPGPLSRLADRLELMKKEGDLEQYEATVSALRALRLLASGSLTVSPSLRETWKKIRGGKPLTVVYGMTESMMAVSMTDWRPGSVEYPLVGVSLIGMLHA